MDALATFSTLRTSPFETPTRASGVHPVRAGTKTCPRFGRCLTMLGSVLKTAVRRSTSLSRDQGKRSARRMDNSRG